MRRLFYVATQPWHPGGKDILTGPLALFAAFVWTVFSNLFAYNELLLSLPGTTHQQLFIYWIIHSLVIWLTLDFFAWFFIAGSKLIRRHLRASARLVIVAMVLSLISLPIISLARHNDTATDLMEAYLFTNYNPDLGLISEAPNAEPTTYFLYSDNYVASLALEDLDLNVPSLGVYKVLAGYSVDSEYFANGFTQVVLDVVGDKVIKSESPDPTVRLPDWKEYADRLLLSSINYANRGDLDQASGLFDLAAGMYDGTGLNDKAAQANGEYATYKLALYIIAANRLNLDRPELHEMADTILALQESDPDSNRYGGIYTEYDSNLSPLPHTDTNTETTALCLFALTL